MLIDRVAFDLPVYDGLLAGHYVKGQGYGRRRPGGTDDWLLIMTLGGEGRFGSTVGELVAKTPSLVLLSPGTTHDYGTAKDAEGWEILWVHFQPPKEWQELLQWPSVAQGVMWLDPTEPQELQTAFEAVCQQAWNAPTRRRQFAMNALERLLLLCDAQLMGQRKVLDARVQRAADHIHAHLAAPLTIDDLSAVVNLSPSRFSHLFHEQTGFSPRQYILHCRVQRARTLLERTTLGVTEIATQIGMDPYSFSNRFRQEMGLSPTSYRRLRS